MLPSLALVLMVASGVGLDAEDESCEAENETPPVMADSAEAVADRMKCDFCHTVTTDLFWSAIGLTPLGSAFNAQYNKSLTRGDVVDMVDKMCELQADWDSVTDGVPPTAMMEYYQLWVDRDTEQITALWTKDRIRSRGLAEVVDDAARKLFMLSCDQHLRTIDTELVDDFSKLLRKHQKQLHELDWNSREMYARMLSDHDPVHEQIKEVCSVLCDDKEAALKKRRAQAKKQKRETARRKTASGTYSRLIKEAKKSKVLFPGV